MTLDDQVARLFDDNESTAIGSGWLSGTVSVFLGALSIGAVACFYWPALLTSPDVRAMLPMPAVRTLLQVVIGLAFLFGLISALLRQRKVLGLTGMGCALIAGLAGGGNIPVDGAVPKVPVYLGLDWFLLNILLLAVLFIPLERLWPLRPQSVFRPQWTTDVLYFFVSHLLVQLSTLLTLMPSQVLFAWAVHPAVQGAIRSQPGALQFLECAIVADLAEYTVHRIFHTTRWLWPFHAVHHSSTSMDWIAGSRLHVLDVVLTRGITFVPLFVLGFDTGPLYAYLVFVSVHAVFIHANVSWRFPRWVEACVVTPRFHHWHHAIEHEAIDRNFAVHFPWIDRFFGTYYGPDGQWPSGYGIEGHPVPDGFGRQLVYPLRPPRSQP
ncbi:MAG: sterol desaturase family protein [Gemmatimonadaceae bacterium]|nr:sterol desaturase family protein [Gemmatimonadaceae bacterium]